jgi:hypothetical protein
LRERVSNGSATRWRLVPARAWGRRQRAHNGRSGDRRNLNRAGSTPRHRGASTSHRQSSPALEPQTRADKDTPDTLRVKRGPSASRRHYALAGARTPAKTARSRWPRHRPKSRKILAQVPRLQELVEGADTPLNSPHFRRSPEGRKPSSRAMPLGRQRRTFLRMSEPAAGLPDAILRQVRYGPAPGLLPGSCFARA